MITTLGLFVEMGSHKIFAQAGLEPQSSLYLPPEYLGLQHELPCPANLNVLISMYLKSTKEKKLKVTGDGERERRFSKTKNNCLVN
jgi:hypothetical protein